MRTNTHSHTPPLPDMILELFSLYSGTRKDFATDIPAQCQVKVEVDPREHFMRAALKLVKLVMPFFKSLESLISDISV